MVVLLFERMGNGALMHESQTRMLLLAISLVSVEELSFNPFMLSLMRPRAGSM